jgi:hypothetical protein
MERLINVTLLTEVGQSLIHSGNATMIGCFEGVTIRCNCYIAIGSRRLGRVTVGVCSGGARMEPPERHGGANGALFALNPIHLPCPPTLSARRWRS